MKKSITKVKKKRRTQTWTRPQTSPLNTEERLTVLANLIIDKLLEKYGTKLAHSPKTR